MANHGPSGVPEAVRNGRMGGGSFRKGPLQIRQTYFSPAEAKAFLAPIRTFWEQYAQAPGEVGIAALLAVERSAILAVGFEGDCETRHLSTSRRKVLESLKPEDRFDYIDLLLSLANMYYHNENAPQPAQQILEIVVMSDRGNWHVLKDLAFVHAVQGRYDDAVRFYDRAREAWPAYSVQDEVVIRPEEKWESDLFEARFRVAALVSGSTPVSEDELTRVVAPIFQAMPEGEQYRAHYFTTINRTVENLLQHGVAWQVVCRAFGRRGPIMTAFDRYTEQPDGEIPLHLEGVIEIVRTHEAEGGREMDLAEVSTVFESVNAGLGRKAAALLLDSQMTTIFEAQGLNGRYEVLRMLRKAKDQGHVSTEMEGKLEESAWGIVEYLSEESKLPIEEMRRVAGEVLAVELDIQRGSYAEIPARLKAAHKDVKSPELRRELVVKVMDAVDEGLKSQRAVIGLALIMDELLSVSDFCIAINELMARILQDEGRRRIIKNVIGSLRSEFVLQMSRVVVRNAVMRGGGALAEAQEPEIDSYTRNRRFFDFFFVKLHTAEVEVRPLYREVTSTAYNEPVCLSSYWHELFATQIAIALSSLGPLPAVAATLQTAQEQHLRKALSIDKHNVGAAVVLGQFLGEAGKTEESYEVVKKIVIDVPRPEALIVSAVLQFVVLTRMLIAEFGKERKSNFERRISDMGRLYKRFEAACEQIRQSGGDLHRLASASELENMYCQLGFCSCLADKFQEADAFYDLAIAQVANSTEAVRGKGFIFLQQGKYAEAEAHYAAAIGRFGAREEGYHYHRADALYQLGEYARAMETIDIALGITPNHFNFYLTKARIVIRMGDLVGAEAMLQTIDGWVSGGQIQGEEESAKRIVKADINFARAELLMAKGERRGVENHFRMAIQAFSSNASCKYQGLMASLALLRALEQWAQSDPLIRPKVERERARIAEKYPYYPLAQVVG